MLNVVFCQPGSANFDERLTRELEEIGESRKGKFGAGPYLVLTREDEVDALPPDHTLETEDFVIWLDGAPTELLCQASKPRIHAALTALVLGAENVSGIDKISDAVIFFRSDGKPIYSYTASLSAATLSVAQAITAEAIQWVSGWHQTLARHHDLDRVNHLLVSSLQSEADTMRSFLDAWTAMEILINKTFSSYEERFFHELNEISYSDARQHYLERIRNVMKDKYRLVDKFALIASQLCPENADEDVRQLKQAKDNRDDLLHGQDIDEASLPVRTVQELARRYLRLHLAG